MEKVVNIHLGRSSFLLDEPAYPALKTYLDNAKQTLKDDQDREEILTDIELAIADKLDEARKQSSVITLSLIQIILTQMGPVSSSAANDPAGKTVSPNETVRGLYQIPNGAIITGVCNGIAAYLGVDVKIVRILFIAFTLLTKGLGIFLYAILALMLPYADTIEKESKAFGLPFNAQSLADQAKRNYARLTTDKAMHSHWNDTFYKCRQEVLNFFNLQTTNNTLNHQRNTSTNLAAAFFSPMLGVINAGLFVLLLVGIITITTQNQLFQYPIPASIPLWAAITGIVLAYLAVQSPISSAKASIAMRNPRISALSGLSEITVIILCGFLIYNTFPQAQEYLDKVPTIIETVVQSLKTVK